VYRSLHPPLAVGFLASLLPACLDDGRIRVLERGEDDPALALAATVSAMSAPGASAQAYRELALAIEELRPFHDRDLEGRAERQLVFGALPPLAERADAPLPEQVEALALTVWPTALGIEPETGEAADLYLERACGDELARECKYVVPTYRPLVVSELVWRRLKHRARGAYAACRECDDDESYARALAAFDAHQSAVSARRASVGDRIHPRRWPRAAAHATSWPADAPLLVMHENGRSELRGEEIAYGGWRDAIAAHRDGATVLGVHLRPSADVALLRDIMREAGQAGYRDVALAAIAPEYPFQRHAYILAARDRRDAVRVRVRDVDTIQVLVQAMSAMLERADQRIRL
jgi:hypothetical protein